MLESQIYPGGALRREVRAVAAVAAEVPRLLQVEQTPRACGAVTGAQGQDICHAVNAPRRRQPRTRATGAARVLVLVAGDRRGHEETSRRLG